MVRGAITIWVGLWVFVTNASFGEVAGRLTASQLTLASIGNAVIQEGIRSKSEFLRELPPECKAFYTLVYRSRATQCSSFERPRIITSCSEKDSRIVIAIEGEPSGTSPAECQRVDILETSLTTGKIETAELDFSGPAHRRSASRLTLHPARCAACHGDSPKYLADQYPLWPGFYESNLKYLKVGSEEWRGLQRYQQRQSASDLYSQLVPFEEQPATGTSDLKKAISIRLPGIERPFDEFFFNELRRRNDLRVATLFLGHSRFDAFVYALAGAQLGCQPLAGFFPSRLRAQGRKWNEIQRAILAQSKAAVSREQDAVRELNYPSAVGLPLSVPALRDMADRAIRVMYVAERMGLDPHSFVTSLYRDEVKFPASLFLPLLPFLDPKAVPPYTNRGLERLRSLLLAKSDQITRPPLALKGSDALCKELAARSGEALLAIAPDVDQTNVELVAVASDGVSSAWPFAKCIECHRASMSPVVEAPPIPFDDISGFAGWLRAHSDFRDKIRARIVDKGQERMPPNQALSRREKQEILRFVSSAGIETRSFFPTQNK